MKCITWMICHLMTQKKRKKLTIKLIKKITLSTNLIFELESVLKPSLSDLNLAAVIVHWAKKKSKCN